MHDIVVYAWARNSYIHNAYRVHGRFSNVMVNNNTIIIVIEKLESWKRDVIGNCIVLCCNWIEVNYIQLPQQLLSGCYVQAGPELPAPRKLQDCKGYYTGSVHAVSNVNFAALSPAD